MNIIGREIREFKNEVISKMQNMESRQREYKQNLQHLVNNADDTPYRLQLISQLQEFEQPTELCICEGQIPRYIRACITSAEETHETRNSTTCNNT